MMRTPSAWPPPELTRVQLDADKFVQGMTKVRRIVTDKPGGPFAAIEFIAAAGQLLEHARLVAGGNFAAQRHHTVENPDLDVVGIDEQQPAQQILADLVLDDVVGTREDGDDVGTRQHPEQPIVAIAHEFSKGSVKKTDRVTVLNTVWR